VEAPVADPVLDRLARGDTDGAWEVFLDQYRRLIFAVIRRYTVEHDAMMDAFAAVCEGLRADDCARLRRYGGPGETEAKFSTWLVVVLRHLIIDWHRQRYGRPRHVPPAELSDLGRIMYQRIVLEHRSHADTFEVIRQQLAPTLTHGTFLKELREVHRVAFTPAQSPTRAVLDSPEADPAPSPDERLANRDTSDAIRRALETLPDDARLAIQLYVIEELPAAEVAKVVGWPNAKAVYNRVSGALARLRDLLGTTFPERG
jgi:RNA polymerase sigma factor (sigma-70 family)